MTKTFPIICAVTPYTALIENPLKQQATMVSIMVVKCAAVIFAFPCSMILLTNSASSLRILGTLNGIAVSVSAIGRATGPAISGAAFSWGVKHNLSVTPWFLLSFLSALGAIPVWFLIEMDGFSKSGENDDEDSDSEEELLPSIEEGEILGGDERVTYDPYEDAIDTVSGPSLHSGNNSRRSSMSGRRDSVSAKVARKISFSGGSSITGMERRMSSPVGLRGGSVGPGGPRKLSNGLGVTGTGQGTGGTSFH